MNENKRRVQKDGILDLRGVIHINEFQYKYNNSIKKVIIGSSVKTIQAFSFNRCQNLEEIIFEEPCQIAKLEYGCFATCSNLRKIDLPVSIQEIDDNAFLGCPLERVILRGSCRIEKECFHVNSLTYLHIADSIQKLDDIVFYLKPNLPLCKSPCKIYIRPEFHDEIKQMFQGREVAMGRAIEFIGNELNEGYVLK